MLCTFVFFKNSTAASQPATVSLSWSEDCSTSSLVIFTRQNLQSSLFSLGRVSQQCTKPVAHGRIPLGVHYPECLYECVGSCVAFSNVQFWQGNSLFWPTLRWFQTTEKFVSPLPKKARYAFHYPTIKGKFFSPRSFNIIALTCNSIFVSLYLTLHLMCPSI